MYKRVKLFVKVFAETVKTEGPIYEIGSLQVAGQEGFADLRQFFPGKTYIGCDMRPGLGVDKVEDLENGLTIKDGAAPTVLCMETLEHVFNVTKAMAELERIVRSEDGILVLSSVFKCPIHAHPHDFWRFTPQCFLNLLSNFDITLVAGHGNPDFPQSIYGVGIKTKNKEKWKGILADFSKRYDEEFAKEFKYDSTVWKKMKLGLYRKFHPKKYTNKMNDIKMDWTVNER